MEPGAYVRMDAWQLPHPRVIEIAELASLSPETRVYLRGPKDNILLNRRCLVADVLDLEVVGRIAESEATTIEISPDSAFGGAALLFGDEIYIETVEGHVSSLLHAGQCSMRSRRALASRETRHRLAHQEFMVAQNVSESVVLHSVPVPGATLYSAVEAVADFLADLRVKEQRLEPILFEWMWTSEGTPVFIDCKDLKSSQWHHNLTKIINGEVCIIESTVSQSLVEVCMVRDYCSAFKAVWPPFYARVQSEALLSHFFTYTVSVPRLIEMVGKPVDRRTAPFSDARNWYEG